MRNRQSNPRYRQPAYYIENNKQTFFRCYTDERQQITSPMGVSLMLDDGEFYVETDADIMFKKNYYVSVFGQKLRVDSIISRVPITNDKNAYRGVSRYVTKMIIK